MSEPVTGEAVETGAGVQKKKKDKKTKRQKDKKTKDKQTTYNGRC